MPNPIGSAIKEMRALNAAWLALEYVQGDAADEAQTAIQCASQGLYARLMVTYGEAVALYVQEQASGC
jgi:hypothetical protein